jgi:lipopolysaccharide/colanic/teichoic acid biosynthesis glycosyltransferase
MKKILITGATGFLGKHLINYFKNSEYELLLVGRNLEKLKKNYPKIDAINYSNLHDLDANIDVIIHLAVANNNVDLPYINYFNANVKLYSDILNFAATQSVKKVININTLHIFSSKINNYVVTKRLALKEEEKFKELNIVNIFCPMIYAIKFNGKLKFLNLFPNLISKILFEILSSLKPVVKVQSVIDNVLHAISSLQDCEKNIYISDNKDDNFFYKFFKRSMDISFVILTILLFWWLLLVIWILISLSSKGPGIFVQSRVGKGGKLFKCYKFRTMYVETKSMNTHEVDRSSVTKIGRFLRSLKLDELPQIVNILRGELSLVGPRPGLPSQTRLYYARKSRNIYSVLPGITGLAQVNNIDMSTPEKLAECDSRYIAMKSIPLEIKILLKTFVGQGGGDRIK